MKKNPSFHNDFKNVHMTLVKKAPKKSFAQKTDFLGKFSIGKIVFWLKLFRVHFLLRSYVHFRNQYDKTDFLIPHSTYSKKKSFYLLEGTMNFFKN
jgi:hypothetical protein